jgi:RND family efflux transporter MFP subunit
MNKFILPIIVLFIGNAIAVLLIFSGPDAKKHTKKRHLPLVETQVLTPQSYTIKVSSSGKVQASTQTKLVAEVSGRVVKLADNFQDGAFFTKGDILLQIDDADFLNAVTVAKSEVEQKQLQLQEEKARAKVAKQDWRLLDSKTVPDELASRRPHIQTAESALAAAQARLKQAQRNLERTYIRVPYNGQVLNRSVDIGQYVSAGTTLGEIYAKESLEVRLPVSLRQYKQLALQENPTIKQGEKVEFYMVQGKYKNAWTGHVLRSSAALDANTNQLNITARINPNKKSPIKIGQFVRAYIYGRVYQNIYIVPRVAVRQNKEIFLAKMLKNDGKDSDKEEPEMQAELLVQKIEVLHTEGNKSIIKANIAKDAQLVITPMPLASTGLKVRAKPVESIQTSR